MVNATAKEMPPDTGSNSSGTHTPLEVWLQHFGAPIMALACALPTHSSPPHQKKKKKKEKRKKNLGVRELVVQAQKKELELELELF